MHSPFVEIGHASGSFGWWLRHKTSTVFYCACGAGADNG